MLDFSDEHKMAQRMFREWTTKQLAPLVPRMERGELLPYDMMRALIKTFGLDELARAALTRAEGASEGGAGARSEGLGGDPAFGALLSKELARVSPGFTLAFGASMMLAGGAIVARGSAEQKRRFALPIFTGEKIGAWGMTEPGAGSDAFGSMRTTARRDGDDFVLSGQKTFITNAPFADTFVIYAKIVGGGDARSRPFHGFIVEKGAPGLSVGKPLEKLGMHSSPTGEIFLDEVRVPKSQLLGDAAQLDDQHEQKRARDKARDVFHGERTGMTPMCLGIIERCLDDSLAYAKERESWGKKIAEHQLIQDKLARMYMHYQNVKNMLLRQLEKARAKEPISVAEASATKLYCGRATMEVTLEAIQLMGGNGYMREYHVEMLMRDAKLFQIGGGTDEIQIITIARQLLTSGIPS